MHDDSGGALLTASPFVVQCTLPFLIPPLARRTALHPMPSSPGA